MVETTKLIVLFLLTLTATTGPADGSWEKLYETPGRNRWIFAVWLARDGSWRAASNNVILTGDAHGVRTTDLGDYDVYAFGEDASDKVIAVGSRQGIWEENSHGFERVHERPGPEPKGRAAHHDVLDGIGFFDTEHPDRLFALASLSFALWRGSDGTWRVADHDRAARRGVEGPGVDPPKGCRAASWTWLDRTDGILKCQDGGGFLYGGTVRTVAPLGRMPGECRRDLASIVRVAGNLFAACGEQGRVWQLRVGTDRWSAVPGIEDVTMLHARNGCLLAATKRAVYRRCNAR